MAIRTFGNARWAGLITTNLQWIMGQMGLRRGHIWGLQCNAWSYLGQLESQSLVRATWKCEFET